ncbi:MAG TPA: TonB-dependent receptor plug domain-containing protein, partial [Mucilaginibacter sp.]
MKISAIALLIICTGAFTLLAKSGSGQNLNEVKITLNEKDKSLDVVLSDIEKLSSFHFVYESEKIVHQKIKSYSVREASISAILAELLTPRGLGFKQRGDNIIVERLGAPRPSMSSATLITVTGKITDEKGEPRQGVTITVKGSNKSVASKADGSYSIQAQARQVLIFSFVGYGRVERQIGENTVIDVVIRPENSQMADVVVVGYGTQSRRDVTTAISSLKADDINNFPAPGVDKAMTGKMAGVQVLEPNGSPGAGITIAIRGKSSVTAGTSPLYVIDGIPLSEAHANGPSSSSTPALTENPLNSINLSDIESIDVLKDASAAAIYGSRGSNGVVLITTKRGKKEKPTIGYDSYYGYAQVAKELPMLDAYGYAKLIYDAHNNTYLDQLADKGIAGGVSDDSATRIAKAGNNSVYTIPSVVLPYVAGQKGLTNTNWQDAI